ncbi:hypothetical protein C7212DRAFT_210367, partial [Tuber magnatum]
VNKLAGVLVDQEKHNISEMSYRSTHARRQKVLGVDHLNSITSIHNLDSILKDQGKEGEMLYWSMLERRERVLGVGHSNTVASVNNLACMPPD